MSEKYSRLRQRVKDLEAMLITLSHSDIDWCDSGPRGEGWSSVEVEAVQIEADRLAVTMELEGGQDG